jgi:hypothetical protein
MIPEAIVPVASIENVGIKLSDGSGTALVKVTSQDGISTNTYSVNFTIAPTQGDFRVGSNYYDTLEKAVAAVPDKGTVVMEQDVALSETSLDAGNKSYTLDLGGHSLTNDGDVFLLLEFVSGFVSIKNGRVVNTTGITIIVFEDVTLNVLDGEYIGIDDVILAFDGAVVITSGHFVCTGDSGDGCLVEYNVGKITIAEGSAANVIPWHNNPNATDVTVTVSFKYGDIDEDGVITPYDASLVLQHVVGIITLQGHLLKAADTDHDGFITPYDASLILQYVVGIITSLD